MRLAVHKGHVHFKRFSGLPPELRGRTAETTRSLYDRVSGCDRLGSESRDFSRESTSTFVEPTIKLDDDPVRVIHVETAHPTLGVEERLPWATEPGALG